MVSDSPLSVNKIQDVFDDQSVPDAEDIKSAISELQADCVNRAIDLQKIGGGYRFQTKIDYAHWIKKLQAGRPPRMSRALLETLAIVAYRQPVSRGDIEDIRGVSVSSDIMQRLMEREWVKQVGVRDSPGRPALFGTTPVFLSYFNLESLRQLPPLMLQRELGEIARELETPLPPEILAALDADQEGSDNQQDVFELNLEVSRQADGVAGNNSGRGSSDQNGDKTEAEEIVAENQFDDTAIDSGVLQPDAEK